MSSAAQIVAPVEPATPVVYPDGDGLPMSDNTEQHDWIVRIKGGIGAACPDAFVAGDVLWYYVEGDPKQRIGPDVLVAFGRPPGRRGSYMQWEECGVTPQVVVEVWSPKNTFAEQVFKLRLYERLGVQEFITYDPDRNAFCAFERGSSGALEVAAALDPWVSPLTRCRFVPGDAGLRVYGPDGQIFRTIEESKIYEAELLAMANEQAARAGEQAARADRLAERLRALGVDPEE